MQRLAWAERFLGYHFASPDLLEQALTHRSASKHNNERLEYLGDSFLNFTIARRLYELKPEASEGDLSRFRAYLVRGTTLAAIARDIELEHQILVGPGELRAGGARRDSVLANTLEALLGAVVVEAGEREAGRCVERLFSARLAALPSAGSLKDPKTRLQEWLQARGKALPSYVVESAVGDPHRQTFTVACTIAGDDMRSCGTGTSRRKAEQDAAQKLLERLTGSGDEAA